MASSFVAELARRLQGQGAALALPLTWIEQRLAEDELTIEQLVQAETQEQAADQVSMSNSIGSLRFLGATDWREFVEAMSVVEQTLREDPVVRRDGLRHPRPLPPRGREAGAERARCPRARWRARRSRLARRRARRALPDRQWPAAARSRGAGAAVAARRRCAASGAGTRCCCIWARSPITTGVPAAGLLTGAHAGGMRGWMLPGRSQ